MVIVVVAETVAVAEPVIVMSLMLLAEVVDEIVAVVEVIHVSLWC